MSYGPLCELPQQVRPGGHIARDGGEERAALEHADLQMGVAGSPDGGRADVVAQERDLAEAVTGPEHADDPPLRREFTNIEAAFSR